MANDDILTVENCFRWSRAFKSIVRDESAKEGEGSVDWKKAHRQGTYSPVATLCLQYSTAGAFSAADASPPRTRNPAKMLLPKLSVVTLHHPDSSIGAAASANTVLSHNKDRAPSLEAGAYLV
ncbi:hypothetical protein FOPG_19511 [Fusarium oxysporum f. sp. conglutinans race 2 54008]|uniref:Uncharacterized protein n=1 Tax=Fusarium oxysporum f. sp. conglutinans race 2 54008 TaxID=1089457 RepID=X0GWD0_FUSOX|nr:hypothetical protein FOPG_19511 [Fusarium oxysporum f. sp. conglutinans race 2 54008]